MRPRAGRRSLAAGGDARDAIDVNALSSQSDGLAALVAPRSIAVVGASSDPDRIGGRPIRYSREAGFAGPIYPVNPARTVVQNLAAYPSLSAVPDAVDLAVIALPAAEVKTALSAAADKGARAAVVLSSGFGEVGPAGAALQAELVALARGRGMRLLGPNTLGAYDAESGACPTFSSLLEGGLPPVGPLAIVSQSGAYGAHIAMLARQRGIGLARLMTTGNEADVTIGDCVALCARDPAVGLIGIYAEGIRDGRALLAAIAAARAAGKPVVVMKVGRSDAGTAAARSHTASLAGDDAVFAAAMERAGSVRAETTETFLDTLYVLARTGPLPGDALGILTVSGGAGVLMADAAAANGLRLPALPGAATTAFHERNPHGSAANPVDVTAQAINDMGLVRDGLGTLFAATDIAAVAAFVMNWPASAALGPRLKEALREGMASAAGRPVAVVLNAPASVVADYEDAGLLAFSDPDRAIAALAAASRAGRAAAPVAAEPEADPSAETAERPDEAQAAALLEAAGVPMVQRRRTATPEEAAEAAATLGFPVALKILSPDIAHKSEVGGVRLALADASAVRAAAADMSAAVAAARPDARCAGFLVSPMASGIAELIVGARHDPAFGPIVLVGLGGVFTEIIGDVAVDLAPVDDDGAMALLRRLKAWPLLDGARGRAKADVPAAAAAVAALSRFAAANAGRFAAVEINPLLARRAGEGVVGLDAAIEPAGGSAP